MTRTHTVFFDAESLAVLESEAKRLEADFEERRAYIDVPIRSAYRHRLGLLHLAINLLGERAE